MNVGRDTVKRTLNQPFIDQNHGDRDYYFWPNLASAHYADETLELFETYGIKYIPSKLNPPNVPHLRPIENYWALVKRAVYAGGYVAKSMDALKGRIRAKIREVEQTEVIQLFRSIKSKIVKTANEGPYATFH